MERRLLQTVRSDFARLIARKFAPARLLVVGREPEELAEKWRHAKIESTLCPGLVELNALPQNGHEPRFDLAIWLYPPQEESGDDAAMLARLTSLVDDLVLAPALGADTTKRRPQLVALDIDGTLLKRKC